MCAYYLYASVHESTDDAFVDGHIVPISPRVAGHVAKVHVTDNQWINKGDLLVELDPLDFEARLSAGEAALEAARAGERGRSIGVDVMRITSSAGVDQAAGAVAAAKAAVETARAAVAAAQSQVTEAQTQLPAAQAALEQAQAEVQAAEARSDRERAHLQRIRQLVPQNAASEESLSEAEAAERVFAPTWRRPGRRSPPRPQRSSRPRQPWQRRKAAFVKPKRWSSERRQGCERPKPNWLAPRPRRTTWLRAVPRPRAPPPMQPVPKRKSNRPS